MRQVRAQAREQVWQLSPQVGPDGSIVVDLGATIVLAHSEKEGATPRWGAHVRVPPAAGVPRSRRPAGPASSKVLGVSRTSIYRVLSPTAAPASTPVAAAAASAPAAAAAVAVEPAVGQESARPAALAPPGPPAARAGSAAEGARPRGRSRWFVVQANQADSKYGPVVVLSGHASEKAATAALGKADSRTHGRSAPAGSSAEAETGERVLLQVRAADQITSRLVFDVETRRGVVQPGPPP